MNETAIRFIWYGLGLDLVGRKELACKFSWLLPVYAEDVRSSTATRACARTVTTNLNGEILPHRTLSPTQNTLRLRACATNTVNIHFNHIHLNKQQKRKHKKFDGKRWCRPNLLSFQTVELDVVEVFASVERKLQWKIERAFPTVLRQRLEIWIECMYKLWCFLICSFIVVLRPSFHFEMFTVQCHLFFWILVYLHTLNQRGTIITRWEYEKRCVLWSFLVPRILAIISCLLP